MSQQIILVPSTWHCEYTFCVEVFLCALYKFSFSNVHCMIRSHINISFPFCFKTVIKPGCLPAYSLESFLFSVTLKPFPVTTEL